MSVCAVTVSSLPYGHQPQVCMYSDPFSSLRPYAHASGAASLRPIHEMGANEHRRPVPRTSSDLSTVTHSPMGNESPKDRCMVDQLSETSSQSEDDSEQPITERMIRIFPRRKASQLVKAPAMQLKSKEVAKLFHLPLLKAASKLGISPTTLKRACRKIGIFQWPHRRLEPQKMEEAADVTETARKLRLLNPRPAISASEHATTDCSSSRNSSPAADVRIPDHRPYRLINQPGEEWRDAMSTNTAESVRLLAEENRRLLLASQQEEDEDRRLLSQVLTWARQSGGARSRAITSSKIQKSEQRGGSNFKPICTDGPRLPSIHSLLNP